MRLQFVILCLFLCIASAYAKDVITKTDGTKLDVKVEEVTEDAVKYRKASNPDGPIYTLMLTSVAEIKYENGEVESYQESERVADLDASAKEPAEKYKSLRNSNDNSNYYSDAQLIYMASTLSKDDALVKKANKYRKIGWIGGGAIFVVGIWIAYNYGTDDGYFYAENFFPIAASSLVASSAFCLGFNLKANSLMKRAREIQMYSSAIIETDIANFGGGKTLTAGVNVMGNRQLHTQGIGVSVGLNF